MAYLAVDEDGTEQIFENKPSKDIYEGIGKYYLCGDYEEGVVLPKGSIKKLIGKELTWEDEPIELQ